MRRAIRHRGGSGEQWSDREQRAKAIAKFLTGKNEPAHMNTTAMVKSGKEMEKRGALQPQSIYVYRDWPAIVLAAAAHDLGKSTI